jgi:hypothetical protein
VSTLIAVYNSEGCVGRCDAKCYEAAAGDCHCICGGKNHGAGRQQAERNVRQYTEAQLREIEARGGYVPAEFRTGVLL